MTPVNYEQKMEARLLHGITMDPTRIGTLLLTLMYEESRETHIFPEIKISPLISLRVLCDNGCNITLDKKMKRFQSNGQKILTGHRKKHTIMWEVTFTKNKKEQK